MNKRRHESRGNDIALEGLSKAASGVQRIHLVSTLNTPNTKVGLVQRYERRSRRVGKLELNASMRSTLFNTFTRLSVWRTYGWNNFGNQAETQSCTLRRISIKEVKQSVSRYHSWKLQILFTILNKLVKIIKARKVEDHFISIYWSHREILSYFISK